MMTAMKSKAKLPALILAAVCIVSFGSIGLAGLVSRGSVFQGSQLSDAHPKTFSQTLSADGIREIYADCELGGVYISPCSGDDIEIHYTAYDFSELRAETDGSLAKIKASVTKNSAGSQFRNKKAQLVIGLPEKQRFHLHVDAAVGDIGITGVYGDLSVDAQIGNIEWRGSADSSSFGAEIGNLELAFDELRGGDHTILAEIGNIELELPEDAGFTLDADCELGGAAVSGTFDSVNRLSGGVRIVNGSGDAAIRLNCEMGAAQIKQK